MKSAIVLFGNELRKRDSLMKTAGRITKETWKDIAHKAWGELPTEEQDKYQSRVDAGLGAERARKALAKQSAKRVSESQMVPVCPSQRNASMSESQMVPAELAPANTGHVTSQALWSSLV